jgi:hypothetical protein
MLMVHGVGGEGKTTFAKSNRRALAYVSAARF